MQADRERQFHDALFSAGGKRGNSGDFYAGARISDDCYRSAVFELARDRRVLEIGCGLEALSPSLSDLATEITGIDISPVAVDLAREAAEKQGITHARVSAMNAEELELPSAAFDVVFGASILHHVRLEKTYPEIARVLTDTGKAVFFEPLGHNALINLYRRLTPNQRTVDEHPLLMRDLDEARAYFERVDLRFFHLTSPAAVLFKRFGLFEPTLAAFEHFDAWVLNTMPFLRRYAWIVVLSLERPRR